MTTNKKPQVVHKTDWCLRPMTECGITIRHSIKSQEAWKFVTCKKCLRMRRGPMGGEWRKDLSK
jgi:hypothetical protein